MSTLWELLANRRLVEARATTRPCRGPGSATSRCSRLSAATSPSSWVQIVCKAVYADASLRFKHAPKFINALEVLSRRAGLPLSSESLAPGVA